MKHKIITFGELMLRLSPDNNERFTQAHSYEAVYGGGEANTAVSLANFNVNVSYVTKLPEHTIGQSAVNSLRQYGVGVEHIVRGGEQIGIYFLEKKTSQRPTNVIYNRKGSAFALANVDDFDWDSIFADATWFHFSGITPAISDNMAHLKKSNLQNGILTYSRKKTGQRLTILWEELMQEIVDKYKDDTSEYLLPILRYCDINDRKQYKLRAKQIGRGLNKIGLRLELKAPLTFYVARHSWASIAQDRKVSTDIIREGLGHDNEKTTHIYLASISTSQIDRANQIILKGL